MKTTLREDVRQELGIGAHRKLTDQQQYCLSAYLRWCNANSQPALPDPNGPADAPTPSTVLLRYLHSNATARNWSHATCSAAALLVAQHLMTNGYEDPRDTRVKAWLKARLRETGKRVTQPTDTLTSDEVKVAATKAASAASDSKHLVRRRALVALADALEEAGLLTANPMVGGSESQALHALKSTAFIVQASQIRVRVGGQTAVITKKRTPIHYEAVATALELDKGNIYPFLPGIVDLHSREAGMIREADRLRLRHALHRTARHLPTSKDGHTVLTAAAKDWWDESTGEQRLRLLVRLDGRLAARVQELAYFLTGIVNLHRHAELSRLTIGHLTARPGGYDYTLHEHKGSELAVKRWGTLGKPVHGALDHAAANPSACPATCPACAMDSHLALRREDGATDTDPLFVSLVGTAKGQVLHSASGASILKRYAERAGALAHEDGSSRRIGSRTMRATGTTILREAGASYLELMEAGGWSSPLYASLYVRRNDAWVNSLVLPLDSTPGE